MAYLIAPSEPPLIKSLGTVSSVPERHGADILWGEPAVKGLVGIQRKEISDLVASIHDGRIQKEIHQLTTCSLSFLAVEGKPHWSTEGQLMSQFTNWTRSQHRSFLRSVQMRGVMVEFTDNTADTVALVEEIRRWAAKKEHLSLDRRPKPDRVAWGMSNDKAWGCHVLQSVEGIGPKQAEAIWDHCGRLPFGLTLTPADLAKIPGIGPKRVQSLVRAFGEIPQQGG